MDYKEKLTTLNEQIDGMRESTSQQSVQEQVTEKGWMDHYTKQMSEISRLELELKQGPPSDVSKWQRDSWKEEKNRELQRARAQGAAAEKFFAASRQMTDDVNQNLELHKEEASGELSAETILETLAESTKQAEKADWSRLAGAGSEAGPQVAALTGLLEELENCRVSSFTSEKASELVKRYNALDLNGQANASQYLDEVGAMDPQSCYLLLCHCTVAALKYQITDRDRGEVDEALFTRLYALSSAYTIGAATLCVSDCFQQKREENARKLEQQKQEEEERKRREEAERQKREQEEAERRRQEEEERKRREAEEQKRREFNREVNMEYLRTGKIGTDIPEEWSVGPYADLIAQKLKEDLEKDAKESGLKRKIMAFEDQLKINEQAVRQYAAFRSDLTLGLSGLEEKVYEAVCRYYGRDMFLNKDLEEELKKNPDEKAIDPLREEIEKCRERQEKILTLLPEWKEFPQIWRNEQFGKLVTDAGDDEAFAAQTEELCEQVRDNLSIVQEMLGKQDLNPVTRMEAMKSVMRKYRDVLCSGTSGDVALAMNQFLLLFNMEEPELVELEKNLRDIMKELEVPRSYRRIVSERLVIHVQKNEIDLKQKEKDTLREVTETFVAEAVKHADGLKEILDKEGENWNLAQRKQVLQWYKNHSQESTEEFRKGLQNLVSEENFKNLKEQKEAGRLKHVKSDFANRLCREELCGWEEVKESLKDYVEDVAETVSDLLSKSAIKRYYLKDVRCLEDLNGLSVTQQRDLVTYLRDNLICGIGAWNNIHGVYGEGWVKKSLLTDLLSGSLNDGNAQKLAEQKAQELLRMQKADSVRFMVHMLEQDVTGERKIMEPGGIRYRYEKGENKIDPESRMKRFRNARKIWEAINSVDKLRNDVYELIYRAKWEDVISYVQKNIVGRTIDSGSLRSDIPKLSESEYADELMMFGAEAELMSQGCVGEGAFFDKDAVYRKKLKEYGACMVYRMNQVEQVLNKVNPPLTMTMKNEYARKMSKLAAGMEPMEINRYTSAGTVLVSEDVRERNRMRFGAEDWDTAREMLQSNLDNLIEEEKKNRKDSQPEPVNHNYEHYCQTKELAKFVSARKEKLAEYEGGLFREALPMLMQDRGLWQTMVYGSEEELYRRLEPLKAPLRAMKKLSTYWLLSDQYLMAYGKDIMDILHAQGQGEQKTRKYVKSEGKWEETFRSYEQKLLTIKISGQILGQRIDRLGSKSSSRGWDVFLEPRESVRGVLMDDKRLDYVSTVVKDRVTANKKVADSYRKSDAFRLLTAEQQENFDYFIAGKLLMEKSEFYKSAKTWNSQLSRLYPKRMEKHPDEAEEQRRRIHAAIDQMKREGRQADEQDREILDELRTAIWSAGSPILAVLGREEKLTEKDIKTAEEQVSETKDTFLRGLLVELKLADEGPDKDMIRKWLDHTRIELARQKIHAGDDILTWLAIKAVQDGKWPEKGVPQQELIEQCKAFRERQELLRNLQKLSDNMKKTEYTGALEQELKNFISSAAMGVYTLTEKKYKALMERRLRYFTRALEAEEIFEREVKLAQEKYKLKEDECRGLLTGLWEMHRADFLKEESGYAPESLRGAVQDYLNSAECRQYLCNSEDRDKLTGEGTISGAEKGRMAFEQFLQGNKNKELLDRYNELDETGRQIFALALTAPEQFKKVPSLPGSSLVRNENADKIEQRKIMLQLQNYITHQAFAPSIDYQLALEKLSGGGIGLDETVFDDVMTFTRVCIRQYQENSQIDWERLRDADESIEAARTVSVRAGAVAVEKPKGIRDAGSFKEKLLMLHKDEMGKMSESQQKLAGRLAGLDEAQLCVLIAVLQDRTALDYTTKIGILDRLNGEIQGFANEEKRQELKNLYGASDKGYFVKLRANSLICNRAINVLFSYQIRDDIELGDDRLEESDFAPDSLQRTTSVDWGLLESAMKLLDEINQDHLKFNSVQESVRMIRKSGNQKAIDSYAAYDGTFRKKEPKEQQESFERFFGYQAKKDGKDLLYAAYQTLEPREKDLFIKALGNRDILDISEERTLLGGIFAPEPDYVNQRGRDKLTDEYITNAMGRFGGVKLEQDACRTAFLSMLSTQVNDREDFAKLAKEGKSLENAQVKEGVLIKEVRETAVDWQLVYRALQFVRRTANERNILKEDRELYRSQGDIDKAGHFTFESGYLRKSRYQSGSRLTRHLKRRTRKRAVDLLNKYMPMSVQLAVRAMLPVELSNEVNKMQIFENGDLVEAVRDDLKVIVDNETFSGVADTFAEKIRQDMGVFDAVVDTMKETAKETFVEKAKDVIDSEIVEKAAQALFVSGQETQWSLKDLENLLEDLAEDQLETKVVEWTEAQFGQESVITKKLKETLEKIDSENMSRDQIAECILEAAKEAAKEAAMDMAVEKLKQAADKGALTSLSGIAVKGLKAITAEDIRSYIGEHQNSITKYISDHKKDIVDFIRDHKDDIASGSKYLEKYMDVNVEELGIVMDVADIIESGLKMYELKTAYEEADQEKENDEKKTEEAKKNQTRDQQALSDQSIRRNLAALDTSYSNAMGRHTDEIISRTSEIAGSLVAAYVGDESGLLKGVVEEAGEFINLFRGYMNDRSSIVKYFEATGELDEWKEKVRKTGVDTDKYSDIELLQQVNGFEDLAEMAYYVGVNMVRSLLFCAGPFNAQLRMRLRSIAVLVSIGMEQAIGQQDDDMAEDVLKALLGAR